MLPTDTEARKNIPMARGLLYYFADALAAVAVLSKKGNDKHNPGQELHWSRDKSTDHMDCVIRHAADAGPSWTNVDPENDTLCAVEMAWRALAVAQIALERGRECPVQQKPVRKCWMCGALEGSLDWGRACRVERREIQRRRPGPGKFSMGRRKQSQDRRQNGLR